MLRLVCGLFVVALVGSAQAQDLITKKQVFELPSFTTQSGRTLKTVKVGWESYGTLNADKSNAILICHFFSGTGHAAGKYAEAEKVPGYWDAIIGPGKAIDTAKYFVFSSDTLVNLSPGDPNVTTTGPASIDPDTGKPYGYLNEKNDKGFPIVSIRDFIEVQKKLVDSLGIRKLVMVAGASMGGLQTYEWAAAYPDMVSRIMPVIASAEADAGLIDWLDIWAMPIRLDPKWNGGDYYGKEPPLVGLAQALKIVTLHAQTNAWATGAFGVKWTKDGDSPATSFSNRYLVETALDNAGAGRAKTSDANSFLYLVRANQLFAERAAERLKAIKAPTLIIYSPLDQVFAADSVKRTAEAIAANGAAVDVVALQGNRGHLDGVLSMKQAEKAIAGFLAK
ncbi:MAG: homoserine O-acetyltransferase [Hyphomonadaceae bacterium]|jgi:homoserine O-acetyltransferase|nr:homoserine O-acetyltransferase [Hyphomonadaceae bacterium]